MDWFLPAAYSKRWKERGKLKKELLSRKKPELKDLENSQPMHNAKKKKWQHVLWREHQGCGQITFCYREQSCDLGIQQPPQQKCCQLGLKGTESGQKWRKAVRLLGFYRKEMGDRAVCLQTCYPSRKGKNDSEGRATSFVPERKATSSIPEGRAAAQGWGGEVAAWVGPEDRASGQGGLFLSQKIQWNLPC